MEDDNHNYRGPTLPNKNSAEQIKFFKRFNTITSGIKNMVSGSKIEIDGIDEFWRQMEHKNF